MFGSAAREENSSHSRTGRGAIVYLYVLHSYARMLNISWYSGPPAYVC